MNGTRGRRERFDVVIRGASVLGAHGFVAASIGVVGEWIAALRPPAEDLVASETIDARGLRVLPARVFGLAPGKGRMAVGGGADLVLFDPKHRSAVSAAKLHTGSDVSPYEGLEVRGAVVRTLVRGRSVWADGELVGSPGWGRFVPAV